MIKPAIPADESRRLQTLRDLQLLDTAPEERFDRVTRLAKQVFATPIALVSLVDADRQWFKSRQGLDATETPRDISFCGHAILDDKILIVNDAETDERFCDNPLVCGDPDIRFYAGYPLAAPDGSRIGTLCVIDKKPREINKEQLQLLRELGRMVEEELVAANNATIDASTSLSNRNGFKTIADHILPMCRRKEQPATLLIFHVPDLQAVEAESGRDEADAMAVELAHMLSACFRDSDIVARLYFDIFCVLLAGTDLDGADPARHRFEAQLSERNRNAGGQGELHVEACVVAYKEGRHADAEAMLEDGLARILEDHSENVA